MRKTHKFIRLANLVLIISLFLSIQLSLPYRASAAEKTTRMLRAQNIYYVTLNGCNYIGQQTTALVSEDTTSNKNIFMVGDSIGVGIAWSGVETSFNGFGWNITHNVEGGRGLYSTSTTKKDGIRILNENINEIQNSGSVVVELGTNVLEGDLFESKIREAVNIIKSANPTTKIYWANIPATSSPEVYSQRNRTIESLGIELDYTVIPFYETLFPGKDASNITVAETGDFLSGDNVHPNTQGTEMIRNKLVETVVNGGSTINTTPAQTDGTSECSPCPLNNFTSVQTTASANIPEPHRSLFIRVSAEHNINPNFLAAIFLSEQGNIWKPFDAQYASSPVGASGPFQFMPGTWGQYGTDGNGDGIVDIQNFEDAATSAAKLLSTGTNPNTPLGDINLPFKTPDTMLYFAAAYNWGGGNIQKKTNENSPLTDAPKETENYLKNVEALISSDFTKSGHPSYGDPRPADVGQDLPPGLDGTTQPVSQNDSCSDNNIPGVGELITNDPEEARNLILNSTNVSWGNYGSANTQKQDVSGSCVTNQFLLSVATIVEKSGVPLLVNAIATDHGGCSGGRSNHNHGRAIDIGYYGSNSAGADRHKPEGDTLYKFLYDNKDTLKIDELIWQEPPTGYDCINDGNTGDCYALYGQATMNDHYHHIHVSFTDGG